MLPIAFCVIAPAPLNTPLKFVLPVLLIVKVVLVFNTPLPPKVIVFVPPILEFAVTLNGFDIEKAPLLDNVPPLNTNFPTPKGPLVIAPVLLNPIVNVPALIKVLSTFAVP